MINGTNKYVLFTVYDEITYSLSKNYSKAI